MYHQKKIEYLLNLAKDLNFVACAAGSSLYLPAGFVPSDIDIFVNDIGDKAHKDFHEQLLCLDEFTPLTKESNAPKYGMKNNISGAKYCMFEDVEVNVIGFASGNTQELFTADVIESFDYGVVQIGFDVANGDYVKTDDYTKDHANKTLTLLNVNTEYHLTRMGDRLAKLQSRFPDYRVVITEGFYKGNKKIKPNKVFYKPYNVTRVADVGGIPLEQIPRLRVNEAFNPNINIQRAPGLAINPVNDIREVPVPEFDQWGRIPRRDINEPI